MGIVSNSFQFQYHFPAREQQWKADALSRYSYLAPQPGDSTFNNQKKILLRPSKLQATIVYATPLDLSLLDTIRQRLHSDDFVKDVLAHISPSPALAPHWKGHLNTIRNSSGKMAYS